ncbi:antigen 5 like allergen Cul n 1-like [Toxorhynchites rutilus septentrionalis]|uniref:antigen 5 like allergen Cul n 1-like n=1 Tax=Toxorhynchites rutilus septentrionalis TaxID=329112 RepID=UPI002478B710|nr:antigen 5 like allergen Cul n 1-like [Toxorhynchites rutilus septentrionalis]
MAPKASIVGLMIVLLVNSGCRATNHARDYCQKDVCPGGKPNIGCHCGPKTKAASAYGSQCSGKHAHKIVVDSKLKNLILREHNMRRNLIACGSVAPYPAAAKMTEVTWDDELEYLAWCNTRSCVYDHDQCRSTIDFPFAGQNIAARTVCQAKPIKPEELITSSIDIWFMEHQNATPAMIDKFPGKHTGNPIGHFTVLVNDRVRRIGCSLIVYETSHSISTKPCLSHYIVCNYSYINFMGEKTYNKSDKSAVDCSVRSSQYSCLCGSAEPLTTEQVW